MHTINTKILISSLLYLIFSFIFTVDALAKGKKRGHYSNPPVTSYIGVGVGNAFYLGDQRLFELTTKYNNKSEFMPSYTAIYGQNMNSRFNFSIRYQNANMFAMHESKLYAFDMNLQQFALNYEYSLNDNADFNQGNFTINAVAGLGFINYKARFYNINSAQDGVTISSIGYGQNNYIEQPTKTVQSTPETKYAMSGVLGLNLGVKVADPIYIFWQNSLNLTSTSQLTGNLLRNSTLPPDSYFYTGIGLMVKIGTSSGKACPRFY